MSENIFNNIQNLQGINNIMLLTASLLDRRDTCFNLKKLLLTQKVSNSSSYLTTLNQLKGAIIAYYDETKFEFDEFMSKTHKDKFDRFNEILSKIETPEIKDSDLYELIDIIGFYLYTKKITNLVTRKIIDTRSPKAVDKDVGLW
jgi:hypothetical protein